MITTKWQIVLLDTVMIVFLMLFPHFGGLPMFVYPIVVLLFLWLYLKLYRENFRSIGFRFSNLSFKAFLIGGAIGLAYAMLQFWAIGPLIDKAFQFEPVNYHDFDFIKHNLVSYLLLLLLAAVLVIPYEEIAFRGFILTRVRQMAGGSKWAFEISGLVTAILFALYHYQEGPSSVISIFIFALFITWLYKIFKGNLWYLIFFHILYDVFMLTAIRLGYL
ncbi:CPBP family intramembrane metalloprotease [Mucilaginibacter sp. BJC16-A38]|uniref:CPBP family intramembrane glutamic endopeptidase n=1 Tax=Mucilaginibacter phenanthrenivorans TaxID=1234842 RepID=UPI0021572847|nr:CPBP family intramembrane glutamic endopeptidase [Mucilaginibacter phenanthrenivorans]MCR8561698.1 CPBP family intramembrane metalloprotease [Mucilaginibacter phenanthrenivorans]